MAGVLLDLDLKEELYLHHYKCGQCGTYYRLEWYMGYTSLRLVRLTHLEMYGSLPRRRGASSHYRREYDCVRASYRALVSAMQASLNHGSRVVRDFAGETLADEYKKTRRKSDLVELLRHPDADVRQGALWSFAEYPWHTWSLDRPTGCRVHVRSLDKKPYIDPVRVLRELVDQLIAQEAGIRRFVSGLLRTYIPDDKLAAAMRRIPEAMRSSELKVMLIERTWAEDERVHGEIARYLADPDQTVRHAALDRARCLSNGQYGQTISANVETISAGIRKLMAAGLMTEAMRVYLEDPAGPPEDYDPYD